jgi:hypothetical protein
MTRRIPNLETAIEYCRVKGYEYYFKKGCHFKFYIEDRGCITLSTKKDNPDRVRKDIERVMTR